MTIRVKLKKDKAIVRFNNPLDKGYFIHLMTKARDEVKNHPKISVKGPDNVEIREPKPSKPPVVKPPPEVKVV